MLGNRIQVWMDRDLFTRASEVLKSHAIYRRSIVNADDDESWRATEAIRQIERDADELENITKWETVERTEGAEITAIKEVIDEFKGLGFHYHETLAEDVRGIVQAASRHRQEAYSAYASLVEEMRTNIRALQFMAKAILDGGTHRIKNSRCHVLTDAIDTMVHTLMEVDVDNPSRYDFGPYNTDSWDFRKLFANNMQLRQQIKDLQEAKAADELIGDKRSGDDVPF